MDGMRDSFEQELSNLEKELSLLLVHFMKVRDEVAAKKGPGNAATSTARPAPDDSRMYA